LGFFADLFLGGRPSRKRLEDVLFETKSVKIHGVFFEIRKLNPVDYMRGAKVHHAAFQTYEKASAEQKVNMVLEEGALKKVQDHYADVFISSVVSFGNPPQKLCYKKDEGKEGYEGALCVDKLFTDWDLANELYTEIIVHSFGKKKET
jgi:hypothetical protein